MMNFCIQCGTKAKPSAKFCAECGTALAPPPETHKVEPNIQANDPPFLTERKGIDESIYAPPLRSSEPSSHQNASTPIRENEAAKPLALWNPDLIMVAAFFLTPMMGAWLTSKNWRALGNAEKAERQIYWLFGSAAYFAAVIILVSDGTIARGLGLAPLAVWYLASNYAEHREYIVKIVLGAYDRRPWLKVILIGIVCLTSFLFFCGVLSAIAE